MTTRVVVRAPATVANLGPGFDVMGCALAWYDEIRVELHQGALEITASGPGADSVPRDGRNFVAIGLRAVLGEMPAARIHLMRAVAPGRGFGSSAIGIVAGLVAGRALGSTEHSTDDLIAMATEIEGHADNVAPCLTGGITVVTGRRTKRIHPPAELAVLVAVAPSAMATTAARGVLPDVLSRRDAVATSGRTALLVAALATGDMDALMDATDDVLHQPSRFALMPDTAALVHAARANGIAAFLSGAGPSVSAFVPAAHISDAERLLRGLATSAWEIRQESFDRQGAVVTEAG